LAETEHGEVEAARAIEPLCILWCIPGFIRNQWTHAFKLLKISSRSEAISGNSCKKPKGFRHF
jgi:hypothetical protein